MRPLSKVLSMIMILAFVLALMPMSTVSAAGSVLQPGSVAGASQEGVRFREFGNGSNWSVGVGKPPSPVSTGKFAWKIGLAESNHIKFVYDATTHLLTAGQMASGVMQERSYAYNPTQAVNYLEFMLKSRNSGDSEVQLNNIVLNGNSLGNLKALAGSGSNNWMVKNYDLSAGFTVEADITVGGNATCQECEVVEIWAGYVAPTPGPSPDLFCTGETGYVDVKIPAVTGLFGYQFKFNYDATLVSATGAFNNSWFDTVNNAFVPTGWTGGCANGTCQFAASKQGALVAGLTNTEPQTVARITFTGVAPGQFTPSVSASKLSDRDGKEIAGVLSVVPTPITVCGWASASGKVNLQGRTSPISAGKVKLTDGIFGPYETAFSATDGTWSINNIRVLPTGTPYTFDATHGLYLGNQKVVTLTHGMTDVSTTKLLGGDADNSGKVQINDLTCIGSDFGGTPNVCGTTGSSDINEDGTTNIFDLTIAGGNYDLASPQGW